MAFNDLYTVTLVSRKGETPLSIALPFVSGLQYERRSTAIPQWTLGGRSVHFHHAGVRGERFSIVGRSGVDHRRGKDANGARLFARGPELFREVEKFFHTYETLRGNQTQAGLTNPKFSTYGAGPYGLIFRAVNEDKSLFVELLNFEFSKDAANTRLGYAYKIDLLAYGEAKFPVATGLANVRNLMRTATQLGNQVTGWLGGNALVATLGELRGTLRGISGFVHSIDRAIGALRDLSPLWPQKMFSDTYAAVVFNFLNTSQTALMAVQSHEDDFLLGQDSPLSDGFVDLMRTLKESKTAMFEQLAYTGRVYVPYNEKYKKFGGGGSDPTGGSGSDSGMGTKVGGLGNVPEYGQAPIISGQSLEDFSEQHTGDPGNASLILEINDMASPNQFSNGAPVVAGTVLLYPLPPGVSGGANLSGKGMYYTDLKLVDGDLVLSGNDLRTVRGVDNLKQAVTTRLLTESGEVPSVPTLGMPRKIGTQQLAAAAATISLSMKAQLESDSRIVAVEDLSIVEGAGTIEVRATILPVAGPGFDVTTEVETF